MQKYYIVLFLSVIGLGFTYITESEDKANKSNLEVLEEAKKWWILSHKSYGEPGIILYNETTDEIEKLLPIPNPELSSHALDYDGGSLWLSGALPSKTNPYRECDTLFQISPEDGSVISAMPGIRTQGVSVSDDYIYYSGWSFSRAAIYTITKAGELVDTYQTEELIHSLEVIEGVEMYAMTANKESPLLHLDLATNKLDTIFLPGHKSRRNIIIENNEIITIEQGGINSPNILKRYNKETQELISEKIISVNGWLTAFAPYTDYVCEESLNLLLDYELPRDTFLCPGESLRIEYNIPGAQFKWQDESQLNYLNISKAGAYRVEISLDGSQVVDVVNVESRELSNTIVGDTLICPDEELILRSSLAGATIAWNDQSTSDTLIVNQPGVFWLETVDGCIVRDTIEVFLNDYGCNCTAYIPNVFSPNSIGDNSSFQVFMNCEVEEFEFTIYDRWGGILWTSTDPQQSWRGDVNGTILKDGVFIYQLQYRFVDDEFNTKETGSIVIAN